ncbi:hypothetical protein RB215_17015 (plasmid) [Pseudoalteromonas sp. HL-AS2]|uniref:hypothetical protein n=1 Tax=Pseudoalteromonas TaxID=53246 RepID=UPI0028155DA2|nr:hypothetical protein [Pseudoalteromonas sp. HL-AS2]WMS96104.1 hypothetical protein RB215_17015 [Pseudoalteromonas sp. HL-AS2]
MSDQSLEVWKSWKQAQQKYDYFVIGLAASLFAYLGANYMPEAISISQNSFELLALTSLFLSVASGLIRLENDLSLQATKIEQLNAQKVLNTLNTAASYSGQIMNVDAGKEMTKEELAKKQKILREFVSKSDNGLKIVSTRIVWQFRVRNYSLFFGFLFLVISKLIGLIVVSQAV